MTSIDDEIDTTARTIYGEARGGGETAMTSVANVISNRVRAAKNYQKQNFGENHPLFGDGTFDDCCTRPWQFSCWNEADPNYNIIDEVDDEDPIFAQALDIAEKAVKGSLLDATDGATYYYAWSMHTPPAWAKRKKPCACIGGQYFFNNI